MASTTILKMKEYILKEEKQADSITSQVYE